VQGQRDGRVVRLADLPGAGARAADQADQFLVRVGVLPFQEDRQQPVRGGGRAARPRIPAALLEVGELAGLLGEQPVDPVVDVPRQERTGGHGHRGERERHHEQQPQQDPDPGGDPRGPVSVVGAVVVARPVVSPAPAAVVVVTR
jgi:hypothetical protein